jgi:TRAP-type C4-dicarboxylate transport system permease small subunit
MLLDKAIHILEKFIEPMSRWLNLIAVSFLMVMVLFITADVFLRYVFSRPIEGSYEAVEFAMVFAMAFGIAYTQRQKGHISVEMLVSKFGSKTQAVIDSIVYFISLGFLGILSWQAFMRARVVWLAGDISIGKLAGVVSLPIAPFNYMVALAYAAISVVVLADFLISLSKAVRK